MSESHVSDVTQLSQSAGLKQYLTLGVGAVGYALLSFVAMGAVAMHVGSSLGLVIGWIVSVYLVGRALGVRLNVFSSLIG